MSGCFVLVMIAGVAALVMGFVARDASDPTDVTWGDAFYTITSRQSGDAVIYDFSRGGHVETSLSGSTDTLCDSPFIRRLDVDGDGTVDVLLFSCGNYSYLTMQDGVLNEILIGDDLSSAAGLATAWADEVDRAGVTLLGAGFVVFVSGLCGLISLDAKAHARMRHQRVQRLHR